MLNNSETYQTVMFCSCGSMCLVVRYTGQNDIPRICMRVDLQRKIHRDLAIVLDKSRIILKTRLHLNNVILLVPFYPSAFAGVN